MTKRLFAVRNQAGEIMSPYYDAKRPAKAARDAANAEADCGRRFVTRGPDHWRGASVVND